MTDKILGNAQFDEARQSQLPMVELLVNMGYQYISASEVVRQRGGDTGNFILKEIASEALMRINGYEYNGEVFKFSEKDVWDSVNELESIQFEGLIDTSRNIYNTIMPTSGGRTIKVTHDGKSQSKNFRFIDFKNPENNTYHVTVEYVATGKENIRPDIVCFVNGIPFAVIENKKSGTGVEKAIEQMIRNQGVEKCPRFFAFPQLLVGTNSKEFRYGTTGTPEKFYVTWKEKEMSEEEVDAKVQSLIAKEIDGDTYKQILVDLNGATYGHKQVTKRLTTEQDKGTVSMFEPSRLLDLTKNYIIYDAGVKKIMRYQQFFAIHKMLERVEEVVDGPTGERREGGLVWHTQGSGKSLTMVMFVKALIEDPNIINPRIIIVTDRKDLDKQIAKTFKDCGLKKGVETARSGQHLLDLVKEKNLNVVTTLVHKFVSASRKRADFIDDSKDIFVLVDEAHRTQSGDANLEMNRILPNACYIGFTGTPLLSKDKESWRKFGGYIDKYTIDDALADGVVLPLIYEGRYVDMVENKKQLDRRWEALTADLPPEKQRDLQKLVKTQIIKDNPARITDITDDVEKHYVDNFQGTGLKAQVVAPSKYSAVMMQKLFKESGKVNTALVISDENGIINEEDDHRKEVVDYLNTVKASYASLESYEKDIIDSFKYNDDGVEIIIVVDKLLTGFDAPRNTVLYLAKDLKDHNLLQAIARVNRLYENKNNPTKQKTSGYIVDYSENAKNLDTAMKLFGNFDDADVEGTLIDVNEKIQELEASYAAVHDFFNDVKEKDDDEAYLRFLAGDNDEDGEQKRKIFYERLNKFLRELDECMVLQDFVHEFKHLDVYRLEVKKLLELRKTAANRFAEEFDIGYYKRSLIKILDRYVDAQGVELLTKQINITDTKALEEAVESMGSTVSKAEAIAAQTKRTITDRMATDPEFYLRFSDKVSEILKKMREGKLEDIQALRELKEANEAVVNKTDESVPAEVIAVPGADVFYRNLLPVLTTSGTSAEQQITIALAVFELLKKEAIVDWYRNAEVKRVMRNKLDDYLYDVVKGHMNATLTNEQIQTIVDQIINLAEVNHELF